MRKALELENASEKSAISPGPLAQAGEQLGELLLELGRAGKALDAFQAAIEKEPGRFRSLYGAGIAAQKTGNATLSKQYFSRLIKICEDADAQRPELLSAQGYIEES